MLLQEKLRLKILLLRQRLVKFGIALRHGCTVTGSCGVVKQIIHDRE
jgi:hypothetical protein